MPAGLSVRLPSGEALQEPREGEHILCPGYFHRGLGFPLRDFMRVNLWFVGCQLYHIPPNGVPHIRNFITFCECYLGIAPHFDMLCYFLRIYVQLNEDVVCDLRGAIPQLRPNSTFFSFDLPKSVREWHKSWFYVEGLGDCWGRSPRLRTGVSVTRP